MTIIDRGLPPIQPLKEEMDGFNEWAASRPDVVRGLCEKFPPWHYYDMPKTGQVAIILAYSEDGSVRVLIVGDQISIPTIMPFEVFGVSTEDLKIRKSP